MSLWHENAEWRSCALILALLSKVRLAFIVFFLCGFVTLWQTFFKYFTVRLPIWT